MFETCWRAHQSFEIAALSGTSGGAVCALLAWYGLLVDGGRTALSGLERFWTEGFPRGDAAVLPWDWLANTALVSLARLEVTAEVSPYALNLPLALLPPAVQSQARPWLDAQAALRTLLQQYVDFSSLGDLVGRSGGRPELLVGAVEVLTGDFRVFRGSNPDFGVDAVVASAALPELMTAVRIANGAYRGAYWDGLFAQNPPLRDFFDLGGGAKEEKPDEIWLIRINPIERDREPTTLRDIRDRRNELAGNLSVRFELNLIEAVNDLVRAYDQTRDSMQQVSEQGHSIFTNSPLAEALNNFKIVKVRGDIAMDPEFARPLDHESKLSRDPAFLRRLLQHGEQQADAFLAALRTEGVI